MSLVERALQKLQSSQGLAKTQRATMVVGQVVQREQHEPAAGMAASHHSDKLIRIDRNALRTAGLLPPEQQERRLAAEYRHIKRPLLAAALGRGQEPVPNGGLIMLASALPGEGKTFTSMNVALSMALERDITVLLVDADVAKPHISRVFGVDSEPGLTDALNDASIDIESLVIPTDIKGLSLLPAGHTTETATELLASERMQQIVAELNRNDMNRLVLFDSPPLLLTNESRALADVVGQIVLVVRAGTTPRQAVIEALEFLGEGKTVSLVLNQSEAAPTLNHYGYGYGEYGASDEKKNA